MSHSFAIRMGYIRSPAADLFWFIALPFCGIALALFCQAYLTFVALASINLWITVPHHFGTWCRAYGLKEDRKRFKLQLIVGPVVIFAALALGLAWLPLTVFLITLLWDHQHSLMQQHGLARIYDFKANTGSKNTGKADLWLQVFLFGNMLLTAPLWTEIWVQQLFTWGIPVSANGVRYIQFSSYALTFTYLFFYAIYVFNCCRVGIALNPLKYAFIASSYLLWYYASWHTNSALVFGIAHRVMHGLQYLVIVYWYLERKQERTGQTPWMLPQLNPVKFIAAGTLYALLFQLLLLKPFDEFSFGLWPNIAAPLTLDESQVAGNQTYDLYAATIINSTAILHYYFDSFIWKVSDAKTQEGL